MALCYCRCYWKCGKTYNIIAKFKSKLFGEMFNEPILTWVCPVKSGDRESDITYGPLDVDEATVCGKYSVLKKYFGRGPPFVLSDNFWLLRKV